jgi:hypothetical protein
MARDRRRRFEIGASRSFFKPVDRNEVISIVEGMTLLRVSLPEEPTDPSPVMSADDRIGPLIYVSNDLGRFEAAFGMLNQIAI